MNGQWREKWGSVRQNNHHHTHKKKIYGGDEKFRRGTEKEAQKHNDQEQGRYVGHR